MDNNNNMVAITGQLDSEFVFSHDKFGENFYTADIVVNRHSNVQDRIPLMVSDRVMDLNREYMGSYMSVQGQFRSRNYWEDDRVRTQMSVYAKEVIAVSECEQESKDRIFLEGFICKTPVYRKTPAGREITEIILAVNRNFGKTDYIPCICWGRTARYAADFSVGCHLLIWGRIQSRDYSKQSEGSEPEIHTTYEVSVARLELY